MIELVHKENNRLAQLLGVTKMVLSTYFGTILSVQQQNGRISYIKRRHCRPHKVVTTRTVYYVQFLTVPFHMINGGKH